MSEDKIKEISIGFHRALESYRVAQKQIQGIFKNINFENKVLGELLKNVHFDLPKIEIPPNHVLIKPPNILSQELIKSNVFDFFQEVASLISKSLKNLDFIDDKFNEVMIAIGWMPVDLLYIIERHKIITLYEEKGLDAKAEIEAILVKNYDNEIIEQILNSWGEIEWLSHRFRLMSIGVKAHMRGEYALSIPQLLTHVEGIVRDYFQYKTRVNYAVINEDAKKIICGFNGLSDGFYKATFQFYIDHVMANFTNKPKSEISRHAIFHGVDLDYDNVCNSLKIIFLLDHMIAQINEMKKIEEKEAS